jgi:hypothetical protein
LEIHLDRQIVYTGAVPLETDLLNTNKNAMFALGQLCQDAFGQGVSGPFFTGLACVPNTPAAMNVIVQPGAVYAQAALDATAYSSLAADSTVTMKQGILKTAQTFATPAPVTSGQSIVYLISALFLEADTGATVLPYYNASNPAQAYSGPGNAGTSQNTTRQNTVQLTLTTGVPATTGSQLTPATPAGQTALYTVTVAYGASTVVAGNIASVFGAPRFTGFARGLQASAFTVITGNTTLVASHAGSTIVGGSGTAITATLPLAATVPAGGRLEFINPSIGALTVTRQGSNNLRWTDSNAVSSALGNGDSLVVESDGGSTWYVVGGTAQLPASPYFGANLAASGYQKLPSGMIIQWGSGSTSSGTSNTVFPLQFPNLCRQVVATISGGSSISTAAYWVTIGAVSAASFFAYTTHDGATGSTNQFNYIAIGY